MFRLVNQYYQLSDEMTAHALSDSRVFRLGVKLFQGSNRFITAGNQYLEKMLNRDIIDSAKAMMAVLKEKNLSGELKEMVRWSESQLPLIETMPVRDYLLNHLGRELKHLDSTLPTTGYRVREETGGDNE